MLSYVRDLKDYKNWVDKYIPLNEDWVEEINYLVFIRLEIENKFFKYNKKQVDLIEQLDQKCSEQLSQSCGTKIDSKQWWKHSEVQRIKDL